MRKSMRFYDALPKHKAELIDGRMYVAGSLQKSAMTLGYMVENLGAAYVADRIPAHLLREAVEKVWGGGRKRPRKLADFKPVHPWNYRVQKIATDWRLSLWNEEGLSVWGGTMGIKLGEDVFMPDFYVLKNENHDRLYDYYLDGPPDLIMEISHPYMHPFDYGIRLERYAAAGLKEVWMVDYETRLFEPMILENGRFVKVPVENALHPSVSVEGLSVDHTKLFDSAEKMGVEIMKDLFQAHLPEPQKKVKYLSRKGGTGYHTIPFRPRLDLGPVAITFDEFISWGGEVKFEMMDGKPIFGGGYETTAEWLGLLLMTLGVEEGVKYLPKAEWEKVG